MIVAQEVWKEGTGSDDEIDETRKVIEDILELQKALVELTLKNQI